MIIGGEDDNYNYRYEIYHLDIENSSWVEVGNMTTRRIWHGLSVINSDNLYQFCTDTEE